MKDGKQWKLNMQRQQQQYLWKVRTHIENLPQDPIRPARYLNGVKLNDDEVANITQPLMLPER